MEVVALYTGGGLLEADVVKSGKARAIDILQTKTIVRLNIERNSLFRTRDSFDRIVQCFIRAVSHCDTAGKVNIF